MTKTNTWENDLLLLVFNNTNCSLVGDATGLRGSSTAGSLYVSLHTADPNEGGAQNTTEASFGGYARQAVVRSGAGWTVSGNAVSNAATITFGPGSSGSDTITHFGIGTDASGPGKLLYKGAFSVARTAGAGITLTIAAGDLDVTED